MKEEKLTWVKFLAVWAAMLAFCGTVWGFAIAWVYPLIHRLLQRLGA